LLRRAIQIVFSLSVNTLLSLATRKQAVLLQTAQSKA
jgi:hypothetical protein